MVDDSRRAEQRLALLPQDDTYACDTIARFIGAGLAAGEMVVIIATEPHCRAVRQRLQGNGFDIERATASGRLRFVDAHQTLARILVDGMPDWGRAVAVLGGLVGAAEGRPRVRVHGELVDLLWRDGRREAAQRLEKMWTDLGSRFDFARAIGETHDAARFRLIVDSVQDYAIFMLDARGNVSSWNSGAERIKGWRADEIIGQHFSRFYPEEDVRAGRCEHELLVAASDGRFEDEGWRVRKDGSRFWANVIISRIVDPDSGALLGFAKVTRDLSQRRALELATLAHAAAEAELAERKKADRVRERLIGVVGHDLRAPLSAISMAASVMLKRGTLEGSDGKMAARIARNADRMAKMISQLLDFTRARLGGGIPIDPRPLDLAEICVEIVGDSEVAFPERTLVLERAGDGRGAWDKERMAQVVANLVGNAAKYGAPDRPILVRLDGTGEMVRLSVHNEGEPIPDAMLSAIFDPFRRGDDHRERSESLGLGLFIVDEIVRAHGGTIAATSTAAEGTTFTVTLPRVAPASPATTTT
ncbi:MAG TPA: ATP-binding protein [Polyangia bacterium]